jgi:hypothetical protein
MSWQSCSLCPVQNNRPRLTYQGDLSRLSCLSGPVPDVLSLLSCHNYFIPLSCPTCPVLAVMFWPVLSYVSYPGMYYPSCLLWLSCLSCPVAAFLSLLSFLGYLVLAVLSRAGCPAPAFLSKALLGLLSCWCYVLACPFCSVQAHLSRLTSLD